MELDIDIRKKFKGFELNVAFKVKDEVCGLLGASGSGKSMILRCISGLETPNEGHIILNNIVLFDSYKKIDLTPRERKIGLLFQNYALFPHMNIEKNIGFGLYKSSNEVIKNKTKEIIAMLNLEGLEKRLPSQLSGGQQQRVALARALAIEPEALLLDEPFSALDSHLKSFVERQLIENLQGYHGVTIFVTHNMEEAYRVCDNLVILDQGKVLAQGGKRDIFDSPPNKKAANLTGCKNISKAKVISPFEIEALDWGVKLKLSKALTKIPQFLGIRANHITTSNNSDQENVIDCWVVETTETPFHMTVYLSTCQPKPLSKKYNLQWEVSKDKWNILIDLPQPWKIYINKDKLFIMEN